MKGIQSYIDRYSKIQDAISSSTLYQQAIDSFKTGLKDFSFTPQEQANAYATFIAQTTIGLQAQSMEMALRVELTEIQGNDLRNKSAIETQILKSQALVNAINVKTAQAQLNSGIANALQEKIKCEVLVKSANDNASINKCNTLVEYMNVIGNANNVSTITNAKLHENIKEAIDKIGSGSEINYGNNFKNFNIDTDSNISLCILYTFKTTLSIGEYGNFGVITNIKDPIIEWDFDGNTFSGTDSISYAFKSDGYKKIKVKVSESSDDIIILVEN